jgi:hypothetical protein
MCHIIEGRANNMTHHRGSHRHDRILPPGVIDLPVGKEKLAEVEEAEREDLLRVADDTYTRAVRSLSITHSRLYGESI